jgi:hypothetical protein
MSNVDYPNRSDLRGPAMRTVPGQTYGRATEQMEAQRAVPMGRSPMEAQPNFARPGEQGLLARPSERSGEPITAGAPFGEGPGAEAMPLPVAPPSAGKADLLERVRVIASMYPNPALLGLIMELDAS